MAILSFLIQPFWGFKVDEEKRAEKIIQAYIDSKGLIINPNGGDYKRLMREIIWGEHPDLTNIDSSFLAKPEELEYVVNYAWTRAGYRDAYSNHPIQIDIDEATPPQNQAQLQGLKNTSLYSSDGRSRSITYAYQWSSSGGTKRNPAFPDFGADDCTNFISQTMKAGGFIEIGSGDECKHEDTNTEWYVEWNPSPSLLCLGDFREWEWSTSWSVPDPFRYYFVYNNNYAVSHGWTTSVSTAKYYLSPGDVIQLQFNNSGTWIGFHTMLVTGEDTNDLFVTYHSNAGGLDEVNKPLSLIDLSSSNRFVLIGINYPWQVFLPLIRKSEGSQGITAHSLNPYPAPSEYQDNQQFIPYPSP